MGANMGKNTSLLDALPSGQGTLHVVMLGLDSAGKTTALYRLKFDQYLNTVPTIGFNCEKVKGMLGKAKGINFLVWDVGGQEKLRPLWKSYTRCTDGIVFVLDSVDVERMEEAKMELLRTVKSPENMGVPILVLANKQDLPGAREPRELEKLLGLLELGGSGAPGGHLWHVQPACAITGDGLHEGLEVLYEMILKRRKLAKQCKKKTR
ncbi:ADP ribosylation factor [Oryctes borbonicus]|uniref:ADP-ribosylation factor-like protein 11 n=3 Tax=Scarabaeidae TaxID=7055 RepID=A0A0T6B5C9_9SCAR|nr:adp ribosylation factor-related [Holotrichia oblita]KRT82500.1 ADP ribosylation factor [Oryctes borbonicus]